jgi:hypothetical protein
MNGILQIHVCGREGGRGGGNREEVGEGNREEVGGKFRRKKLA